LLSGDRQVTAVRTIRRATWLWLVPVMAGCYGLCPPLWAPGCSVVRADEPSQGPADTPGLWRTPEHEGANGLYLLLRLSGCEVEYEAVQDALAVKNGRPSMLELRTAAERLGLRTAIQKWRPGDLAESRTPVIAHLESIGGEAGRFVLVIGLGSTKCRVIHCGHAVMEQMSRDGFVRAWSGYVLVPEPPRGQWLQSQYRWMTSVGVGFLGIAVYGWWRIRSILRGTRSAACALSS